MYLKQIIEENVGPISHVDIKLPFDKVGQPKPVILVGENGSGKSTLISNIVDSFYEMTRSVFSNSNHLTCSGMRTEYFRVMNNFEIHRGQNYLYSVARFNNDTVYIYKSGVIDVDSFEKKVRDKYNLSDWVENGHLKKIIGGSREKAEKAFNNEIVCYFSPERYEKPAWLGKSYYDDLKIQLDIKNRINGEIINPILGSVTGEENLKWLLDVIADSRVDVRKDDEGKFKFVNAELNTVVAMAFARSNIERVMSQILGEEVFFGLNVRSAGQSRFNIYSKADNVAIVPTLDSLSSGQLALFNMFATIIRYADNNDINKSIQIENIQGIVVIDEIELHLHTSLQKKVLPQLLKLFPKVQFIITTHSPLFLMGMKDVFGDDDFEIYQMPDGTKINVERFSEFNRAYRYFADTSKHQEEIKKAIDQSVGRPLVVTEGATDWKHMKAALISLSQNHIYQNILCNLKFDFLEYEPKNSKENVTLKIDMGNAALVSMCEAMAKIPQKRKLIFIADRDDKQTNKTLSENGCPFKEWGNNVFSLILPVPDSRKSTPNICIEHYYSDQEIKTFCHINGKDYRLFMGNEFDELGLSADGELLCQNKNLCGKNRISIIDGQSKGRVVRIKDKEPRENIALSKMDFANNILNKKQGFDKFSFCNFIEIFKIIKQIIDI